MKNSLLKKRLLIFCFSVCSCVFSGNAYAIHPYDLIYLVPAYTCITVVYIGIGRLIYCIAKKAIKSTRDCRLKRQCSCDCCNAKKNINKECIQIKSRGKRRVKILQTV